MWHRDPHVATLVMLAGIVWLGARQVGQAQHLQSERRKLTVVHLQSYDTGQRTDCQSHDLNLCKDGTAGVLG
jgi:hypothetical protein